ncbi:MULTISPECIES: MarR family winged helix-turn-helix transcriptional regulator [unclassified Clostridioides]|uniref:MarR family winged helix-turn-helix transcriptional regulator n=1 Tax=unclassified Clostridioides TaxID=2635829 RepID=UPI001D0CBFF1|nr:MarR family transcriptional regulator [Clostridioides sp. ES-S-0001-02]MCC0640429.1 MarR family transcriptional regulator [Clostridioides sp. ES-S-0049-03]MCC0651791.1 MarR family transcriptional regulator [Clostridioides sp. ES-S-0001-03]MCC0657590.1 MarR family transcriptional regulator [Clostridioides sp. ES-S-0123-01]MCC0671060.1 MarR family transcriptional regulator [Clostridioides sp. ES-S-0145-01]MCC0676902.1 MarR family transcriptional regulator [Clostridioides sp. ES-W-0018-02]MCC
MSDKELSILLLESMNNFHNLIKIINNERYKKGKVLTERQFFALVSIRKHNKMELKNLSRDLHVSTSSLCILLNKLVEQDYVYREEDSRDRRNTFYGITESGEKILDDEILKFISIISDKMNCLDVKNKDKLFDSLEDSRNIIEQLF